mmetsp:Transcript_93448/g.246731  ORF Transcript_93448/g.246731 Transcript_93448/m.246731 type:complete len:203 (+) Transcript_93448:1-609(+)
MALQPRALAGRELDGIPFEVMLVRELAGGAAFDVAYLDDGNIERHVPREELDVDAIGGSASHRANLDKLWEDSLRQLAEEDAAESAKLNASGFDTVPAAQAGRDRSRLVTDDGAMSLAAPAPALSEVLVPGSRAESVVTASTDVPLDDAGEPADAVLVPPTAFMGGQDPGSPVTPSRATACGTGLRGIRNLRQNRELGPILA